MSIQPIQLCFKCDINIRAGSAALSAAPKAARQSRRLCPAPRYLQRLTSRCAICSLGLQHYPISPLPPSRPVMLPHQSEP